MKKFLLILVASVAMAQTAPNTPTVRVVPVKNGTATAIYDNLSKLFPGVMTRVGSQIVINAIPASADMLEEAIKKLDAPPPPIPARVVPNVELTVQLLYGSAKDLPGATIPADLESTVRQLKSLFPFRAYRVMETQIVRARAGSKIKVSGNLPGTSNSYDFEVFATNSPDATSRSVRLDGLNLYTKLWIPDSNQFSDARIQTSLDAREGQKTVVGKTNLYNSEDALILVITPKIIE